MSDAARVDPALDTGRGRGPVDVSASPSAARQPLDLDEVRLEPGFWRRRQEVNAAVNLPTGWEQLEAAGTLSNFRIAAGRADGRFAGPPFHDTDLYKWLEAAGWQLAAGSQPELERRVAAAVELVAAAQGEDGYVDTFVQVAAPDRRWLDLDWGHEHYCAGHLIQAAVAVHRATGRRELLDVATRFADLLFRECGPGQPRRLDGHPEVETALVELYRLTGEARYLELAAHFLDSRGLGWLGAGTHGGPAYFQDHVAVRDARTMDGHAVRQLYLLAGVVDVSMETGEGALLDAAIRQWDDMVRRRVYLTGGVGSQHAGESFGESWELPNGAAYCETCAAIASVMLSWRLLLATGESRYADQMERTLLNGFLSGVSLEGGRYFYVNPLLSLGEDAVLGRTRVERFPWHDCACCPPNVMRVLASLGHYLVTRDETGLQLQQYAPMRVRTSVGGQAVALQVSTRYPWDGEVAVVVEQSGGAPWDLALRVPGWCSEPELTVGDAPIEAARDGGYAVVRRAWQPGDRIRLVLPMPARLTEAHPRVDAARGSVAIERGPLVYCLEQPDQADGTSVLDAELDVSGPLEAVWRPDLLDGVVQVEADGTAPADADGGEPLYAPLGTWRARPRVPTRLRAIPYYAWANRGPAAMRVWIPRSD